jgi:hypothetical protein
MRAPIDELSDNERVFDADIEILAAKAIKPTEKAKILLRGQLEVERDGLRRNADPAPDVRASRVRRTRDGNGAFVRTEHAANEMHERALAGAIRTEETERLTLANIEVDAVDRHGVPIALS